MFDKRKVGGSSPPRFMAFQGSLSSSGQDFAFSRRLHEFEPRKGHSAKLA